MTATTKTAIALALAGAMTAGAMSTASARSWKPWAAAGAGFVAGAAVGSAIAAPRYGYYEPGYAGYAYSPGYSYGPAYESYAYQPGYESTVVVPSYGYYRNYNAGTGCATRGNYGGKTDYGAC